MMMTYYSLMKIGDDDGDDADDDDRPHFSL